MWAISAPAIDAVVVTNEYVRAVRHVSARILTVAIMALLATIASLTPAASRHRITQAIAAAPLALWVMCCYPPPPQLTRRSLSMFCRLSVAMITTAISFTGLSAGDFLHPASSASLAAAAADRRMDVQKHSQQSSRPANSCLNVSVEGVAPLGFVEVAPGVFTLAGLPTPTDIGGISGELSSVVTSLETSGSGGQGAQHLTLQHTFVSTDPAGRFTTEDRGNPPPEPAGCPRARFG